MTKYASTQNKVLAVIEQRWSPRAFSTEAISKVTLNTIFEAMSWSASSFNEQPWRIVLGIKGEGTAYDKLMESLVPFNQMWCKSAPILLMIVGKKRFSHNNEPNDAWQYDCGAAAAYISLQALEHQVYVHQMIGIIPEKATELFKIPDDYGVMTILAMGKLGDPDILSPEMAEREKAPRARKPISDLVFGEEWGNTHPIIS